MEKAFNIDREHLRIMSSTDFAPGRLSVPGTIARPIMTQRWRWLTFLHWAYPPEVIQQLLPPGLEVDTFDQCAWVGLVPFVLSDLRWLGTPAIPWISRFPETNVRTYVRGQDGKTGVWFFTLEADRLLGVLGARWLYHLPYRWATMDVQKIGSRVSYRSKRLRPFGQGSTDIEIETGRPLQAGAFDQFLTARFRLYAAHRGEILTADIEHQRWALQSASIIRLHEDLIENSGVPRPVGEPVVHFADGVTVKVDRVRRVAL